MLPWIVAGLGWPTMKKASKKTGAPGDTGKSRVVSQNGQRRHV